MKPMREPFAVVFGTADLRLAPPGQAERVSSLRYSATYVERDRRWRMLTLHMQPRAAE
jgi:hypothetical protein